MKDSEAKKVERAEAVRLSPVIPAAVGEMRSAAVVGAIVGVLSVALMYVFNNFVFSVVLCRNQAPTCSEAPTYAMITGMIIGAMAGVALLANRRVYRPLLVTIAATVALWGFHLLIAGWAWYWALLAGIVLFALAYSVFALLARLRSFVIAVIVTIIVVLIVRLFIVQL